MQSNDHSVKPQKQTILIFPSILKLLMPIWLGVAVASSPKPTDKRLLVNLPGGQKLDFVRIPSGVFPMGSSRKEQDEHNQWTKEVGWVIADELQHDVRIGADFYMTVSPITQAQYGAMGVGNPSYFRADGKGRDIVRGISTDAFPVECVSWKEANAYCEWLTKRDTHKRTFRLPTEAEWEYACKANTKTFYYFGNALNGLQANCDGNNPFGTSEKGPCVGRPTSVGSYDKQFPHPFGLQDMHGNVWQWCRDWYDRDYYSRSPKSNPVCMDGPQKGRVIRGGGWGSYCWQCRSAARAELQEDQRLYFVGFRVVCDTN